MIHILMSFSIEICLLNVSNTLAIPNNVHTANLCNQSVTEGQQIDAILANFLLLQLLFTIFADFWLQIKSASFKCKNYTYYLLHLKAALLKEN